MAKGEEEIGPVPAPAARQGGSRSWRPPNRHSIFALLGVLIATTITVGAGVSVVVTGGGSSGSGGHTTPNPTNTTSTEPTNSTSTESNTEVVYLSRLQPSGGDTPSAGDAPLNGHDYPDSLLYENVGIAPSIADACEAQASCRATSYVLVSPFTRFQATLGAETRGASGESLRHVHWSVVVDGKPAEEGDISPNSAPHPIEVHLAGASNLELRVIVENGFGGTIVWGNARVY